MILSARMMDQWVKEEKGQSLCSIVDLISYYYLILISNYSSAESCFAKGFKFLDIFCNPNLDISKAPKKVKLQELADCQALIVISKYLNLESLNMHGKSYGRGGLEWQWFSMEITDEQLLGSLLFGALKAAHNIDFHRTDK